MRWDGTDTTDTEESALRDLDALFATGIVTENDYRLGVEKIKEKFRHKDVTAE